MKIHILKIYLHALYFLLKTFYLNFILHRDKMRDIILYYWFCYDFIFTKWLGGEKECQNVNIKKIFLSDLKKYLDTRARVCV